jgi:hypothetical protein
MLEFAPLHTSAHRQSLLLGMENCGAPTYNFSDPRRNEKPLLSAGSYVLSLLSRTALNRLAKSGSIDLAQLKTPLSEVAVESFHEKPKGQKKQFPSSQLFVRTGGNNASSRTNRTNELK